MAEQDFFNIHLQIAGDTFPYYCRRSDEARVRKAAANYSAKFNTYSTHYADAGFDRKALLTLTGFHFAVELFDKQTQEDMSPMLNKIEQLNAELENFFQTI
ncbi:MAG: cell division protein ZapA [Candidatus Symbiothrix sp.]|nr:cell division protein ZapA [Candidatus Symbiothrix sp.]